ncbi:MAG: TorF family putative porin [Thiothrix sp.]|uniref:TorF family putative porin n=1 Tax=Thiothrix sp. TaxID=1032 RepID=UPI002615AF65|nr:TorF family putative porin [Thiothrix sp.]MDD5391579.1 TorF family putative porin [Thiothrix sp.]
MKIRVLLTATVLGSLFVSTQALAGASANIGATSNYLWRGITQTQDGGAVQAGLDYKADNGFYVGTWTSNAKFAGVAGTELDLYAGYAKELESGLSYDVGVVNYGYHPKAVSREFAEAYGKVAYKGVGAEVDYTISKKSLTTDPVDYKKKDVYYGIGYNGKLANDWSYAIKTGKYNFDDPTGDDYGNTQLSLTKTVGKAGDFTLAVDKTSGQDAIALNDTKANDAKVSLSWKKSFDF